MTSERPSAIATLASFFAGLGGLGVVLGPALAHFEAVNPFQGFATFGLGGLLALVGLVLGALGLRATRGRRRAGRDRAWFAVAIGTAVLFTAVLAGSAGRGLPRINDITTNPADPPGFEVAARDPANQGRDLAYPPAFVTPQRAAYPDLAPILVPMTPAEAFERSRRTAEALGWEIVRADPAQGQLEARTKSKLFRFVDDISIRVRPQAGGAVVDVRSKSRDGQGDLGANATRIRAFAAALGNQAP